MIAIIFQLISVNISWCELLTAQGVGALAEGCNKLRTFISKVTVASTNITTFTITMIFRAVFTSATWLCFTSAATAPT